MKKNVLLKKSISLFLAVLMMIGCFGSGISAFADDVLVESIDLNVDESDTLYLPIASNYELNPQIFPANATNKALSYEYDRSYMYIDPDTGRIEGIHVLGSTSVTVSTTDGSNISRTFTVNVLKPASGISLVTDKFEGQAMCLHSICNDAIVLCDKNGDPITFDKTPFADDSYFYLYDGMMESIFTDKTEDLPDEKITAFQEVIDHFEFEDYAICLNSDTGLGYKDHHLFMFFLFDVMEFPEDLFANYSLFKILSSDTIHLNQFDYFSATVLSDCPYLNYPELTVSFADPIVSYDDGEFKGLEQGKTTGSVSIKNADGSVYNDSFSVVVDTPDLTLHEATDAVEGKDGNIEYYTNNKDEMFVSDGNGGFTATTAEEIAVHLPGKAVCRNPRIDVDRQYADFDSVVYCQNCNTEILRNHINLECGYNDPDTSYHEYWFDVNSPDDNYVYYFRPLDNAVTEMAFVPVTKESIVRATPSVDFDESDETLNVYTDYSGKNFVYDREVGVTVYDTENTAHKYIITQKDVVPSTHSSTGSCTFGLQCKVCGAAMNEFDETFTTSIVNHLDANNDDLCDYCGINVISHIYDRDPNATVYTTDSYINHYIEGVFYHLDTQGNTLANIHPANSVHQNDYCDGNTGSFELSCLCENCGKYQINTVELQRVDAVLPTANSEGNIEYWIDDNGNVYLYGDMTDNKFVETSMENVIVPKTTLTHHDAVEAQDGQDGTKEYYTDDNGNKYVFEDGLFVSVTDSQLIEHRIEIREVVIEEPTCTKGGKGEFVAYCLNHDEYLEETAEPFDLPKVSHVDQNKDGKCDSCGADMEEVHEISDTEAFMGLFQRIMAFIQKIVSFFKGLFSGVNNG